MDANKRPYSHQWNITVDREIGRNLSLSVAYVGSAGRRLPSSIDPLNAIDPRHLSMGDALFDEFTPGMTSLNGVPLPYPGWVEQMTGCAPSVAQALRPFPQYCDNLQGLNENHGSSMYNSLQVKLEKRFSDGIYGLVSYTLSKTMSERVRQHAARGRHVERPAGRDLAVREGPQRRHRRDRHAARAVGGVRLRAAGRAGQEVPEPGRPRQRAAWRLADEQHLQILVRAAAVFPIGLLQRAGRVPRGVHSRDHQRGGGVRAGQGQLRSRRKGPLFNKDAFEPVSAFNFYYGKGNRIEESVRAFGYHNQDLSFIKNTRMPGNTNLQVRFEIFNLWNWHMFTNPGQWGGLAFNNDLASPDFGRWNGSVTEPRTMQVAARIEF